MYAIVETCGKQYRMEPGAKVTMDRLQAEVGDTVTFDRVLLVGGEALKLGSPTIEGAKVTAKVVEHPLAEKSIYFMYRPKRRYRRRAGYRARLTTVEILKVEA